MLEQSIALPQPIKYCAAGLQRCGPGVISLRRAGNLFQPARQPDETKWRNPSTTRGFLRVRGSRRHAVNRRVFTAYTNVIGLPSRKLRGPGKILKQNFLFGRTGRFPGGFSKIAGEFSHLIGWIS